MSSGSSWRCFSRSRPGSRTLSGGRSVGLMIPFQVGFKYLEQVADDDRVAFGVWMALIPDQQIGIAGDTGRERRRKHRALFLREIREHACCAAHVAVEED